MQTSQATQRQQSAKHPRVSLLATRSAPDWRLKPVATGVLTLVLAATLVPGPAWAQPAGGRVVGGAARDRKSVV